MRSGGPIAVGVLFALTIASGFLLWSRGGGTGQVDRGPEVPEPAPIGAKLPATVGRVALRVTVRAADWISPEAGARVAIYSHDPRSLELPRDPLLVNADARGVVEIADLRAGPYLICAPGVVPGGEPPGTVRVEVADQGPTSEVVVAAAPEAIDVDVDVQARFTPRFGVSTRIVLVRTDDASRRNFPFPRVVEPGEQKVTMRLPFGTYEVGMRPLGELTQRPEEKLIRVSESSRATTLHLEENTDRVEITLRGIPDDELPARVLPIEDGRVQDDRPQTAWWGPFRWSSATTVVPALEGAHRLAVYGRTKVFLSARAERLTGPHVDVDLEPATRLLVDVARWDPLRDASATFLVEVEGQAFLRVLLPTFGSERPDLIAPCLAGELIVPRGGTRPIECLRADGSLAWRRSVALDTDSARLQIEAMGR